MRFDIPLSAEVILVNYGLMGRETRFSLTPLDLTMIAGPRHLWPPDDTVAPICSKFDPL